MVDIMGLVNAGLEKGREYVANSIQNTINDVHKNPALLDNLIEIKGGSTQDFYRALGPSGQENLKGIIAQDANFLPALNKAMEGDGPSSQFSKMPAGLVNVVLAEANQDPKFRAQLTETLQSDPSKVMEVVGKEAGQDTQFGMKLGAEGFKAAMNGEMSLGDMGGMGGALKGMLGGMLGGLMQNMGEFFKQFLGMLGQLFGSIMGFLGGDKLVQSVGDKPPGDRPVDQLRAISENAADNAGVRMPDRGQLYAVNKDGVGPYKPATIEVGETVSMKDAVPKDPTLKDPSQRMMAGPT